MITFRHSIDEGFIIRYGDLAEILEQISGDATWTIKPLFRETDREFRDYVILSYSHPPSLTELDFQFPVVSLAMETEDALICLHPSTAISLRDGLYMVGDQIMLDAMEDWLIFWPPISEAIRLRRNAGESRDPLAEEALLPA